MSFYSDLQMIQKPTPRKKVFQNALSEGITGIQVFLPWVATSKTSINPSAPSTALPLFPKSHSRFFGRNSAKITQRRWTFSFKCLVMCILKLPLSEINHGLTCKPLHIVWTWHNTWSFQRVDIYIFKSLIFIIRNWHSTRFCKLP